MKWEYNLLAIRDNIEHSLNQLGELGWEVCGFADGTDVATFILKRPKQEKPIKTPIKTKKIYRVIKSGNDYSMVCGFPIDDEKIMAENYYVLINPDKIKSDKFDYDESEIEIIDDFNIQIK